ncbi:nitroreductase family deazaflavin-dependent oxidoreductase [Amycolatopsis sp. K13G38]|uniref:Nitroreductase family deazaflavin-dependent oxidoreductase n=1 Tax=Amycolatopsis acididurans TaxID=2724524 RepID=A0ABX1J0U4_9PSEU|nr:nitroreductase family deazaflavin-dependent oxidoreductase [Amycolatopsis acididurans]NKQ52599.1 nitroreductase family deazaflavin-dependent oxidoreductase [Amycolatopsis acididurans]
MRLATAIIWVDKRLYRVFRGKVSLVAIAGLPSLRLTTVGRKSGQPRSTNLLYFPYENGFVLVGSNWGRTRDPGWTYNLRDCPDAVVEVRGRAIPVTAAPAKGEQYDDLWRRLLRFWPGYAMERAEAGRELPIFVLTRRG